MDWKAKYLETEIKLSETNLKLHKADQNWMALQKEASLACQALHEYRDNMATKCDADYHDARVVAGNYSYTGKRALETLELMPISVALRDEEYQKVLKEADKIAR